MKRLPWLEILAALGIAAIALVCLIKLWPAMQTEVSAAWAQGLLTAAGIGAALFATDYQVRAGRAHAREQAEAARKEKQQSLLAVLKAGVQYINELEEAANVEALDFFIEFDYSPGRFSAVVEILRAFPFHEMATSKTIDSTFEIISGLEKSEAFCAAARKAKPDAAQLHFRFQQDHAGTAGMANFALMKIDVAFGAEPENPY